ncbi:MAG: hypothetical protein ACK5Y2_14340 [Bdellovibrionales bacterium]
MDQSLGRLRMFQVLAVGATLFLSAVGYSQLRPLEINPIRFTNRAQCALDSELPTQSAFWILDGFNAGRLGHALARNLGEAPEKLSIEAMKEFRLAVAGLQLRISNKLLRGELPLLPHNLVENSNATTAERYRQLVQGCRQETFCPDLRDYVASLWSASGLPETDRKRKLSEIDHFNAKSFITAHHKTRAQCLLLKKFSPLQGHLHGSEVTTSGLENLAKVVINPQESITSCQDLSAEIDSRNVALQIDIHSDVATWEKVGYSFWNSLKIYFSWAWRHSDDLKTLSPQFSQLFRSLDIEESLLLIPNGCRTIQPPHCDSGTLALNALRELAKIKDQPSEFDNLVSKGPENELLIKGARSTNNDFLGTLSFPTASDWVSQFRKNFTEQRWLMRNKVVNNLNHVSLLAKSYTPEQLAESIKSFVSMKSVSSSMRDEVAYLCLEWQLSSDDRLDFLSSKIDRISDLESMIRLDSPAGLTVRDQITYYKNLGQAVGPLCVELEKNKFFNQAGYETNWIGLENWAKEMTSKSIKFPEGLGFQASVPSAGPFLTVGSDRVVLCQNPIECARRVFKGAVDLLTASQYAEAFLPVRDQVKSPDLFNPYSELKACKVYDPWYVTQRTQKVFLADLVNTALFGWNPLPIYIDHNWSAPRVTSFNQLLKDGKIKFDPNIEKSRIQTALLADLGPWLGTPCAVQVSPSTSHPFNFYAFAGISFNTCQVRRSREIEAKKPTDFKSNEPQDSSFCAGCSLNFVGVASGAAATVQPTSFNPLKFGVYLFRAVYRFAKGMSDKVNVPQSFVIDVNHVAETYLRYGRSIPESCVEALKMGLSCHYDTCGSKVAEFLKKTYGITPNYLYTTIDGNSNSEDQKVVYFQVPGCQQEHSISVRCSGPQAKSFFLNPRTLLEPRMCRGSLKL